MRLILVLLFLAFATAAQSATGDIIYQNCTAAGGCSPGNTSDDGWTRSVETSGCYSGSCLKLNGVSNPNTAGKYGAGSTSITTTTVNGHDEITISQWTKYDEDVNSISGGNMKLDRPYTGSSSLDFYGTSISPSLGHDYYMGAMVGTMINKASWFDMLESTDNSSYPVNNGDGTYTVDGYIKGTITSGGPTAPGTTWVKVTKYLKCPSTTTAADGSIKVWIGDELLYELTDVEYRPVYRGDYPYFTKLSFYPSSEATEPFEHWEDEMIIYEGYWPPVADSGTQLSSISGNSVASGSTSTNVTATSSGNASYYCSETAGTAYASMEINCTGDGTTSHSCPVPGLSDGDDFYIYCKDADNTIDQPIHITVATTNYTLTVSTDGTGTGTITANIGDIDCGSTCTDDYPDNTVVSLTPSPDSGSVFVEWSDSSTSNPKSITMDSAKSITATFNTSVGLSCPSTYSECNVTECPANGYEWWDGSCHLESFPSYAETTNLLTNSDFSAVTGSIPDGFGTFNTGTISIVNGIVRLTSSATVKGQIYVTIPSGFNEIIIAIDMINTTYDGEVYTENEAHQPISLSNGSAQTIFATITRNDNIDNRAYVQVINGAVDTMDIARIAMYEATPSVGAFWKFKDSSGNVFAPAQ